MWAWEEQWLAENKEIFDNEEKIDKNRIQTINEESTVNDNYMNEAKNIFLENMANMDRIMETWEETYSKWESMMYLDILMLENEEEGLNNSCDELRVEIDELKTRN